MSSALLPDPSEIEGVAPLPVFEEPLLGSSVAAARVAEAAAPGKVMRHLVSGTSALGLGIVIERGAGFAANILAARFGGLATFGAYSFAISTANNIATYAAAGIGSTAARFSGKYQHGSSGYGTLARVLAIVSIVSALAASLGLWLGAAPIARLLGQPTLTNLLHWASLSAAGIVVLECARGFFVGQRRLSALVLLSSFVGAGMLSLLPLAAFHHNPVRMIISQGAITLSAVIFCLLLARPLRLLSPATGDSPAQSFGPVLREVWGFGFVQLAGLVGSNVAGWWLITLVARSDRSLVQMGFFGVASQLRNIVGLAPSLLTEGSYAVMADPDGEVARTPQHVLGFTTFASTLLAVVLASAGIIAAPWMLRLLYTSAYSSASVTVAIALALAVMHMGNAPASARLSIVSIRASGLINTGWACFVAGAGTLLMLHGGSAAMAMVIYLAAHTLSSALVLCVLARKDSLPRGLPSMFLVATGSTTALASLAALRAVRPQAAGEITTAMLLLMLLSLVTLIVLGRRHRWLPSRTAVERLVHYLAQSLPSFLRRRSHAA